MSDLIENIKMAKVRAAEDAVIEHLQSMNIPGVGKSESTQEAEIDALRAKLKIAENQINIMANALRTLSCLGNGDRPGNSTGNTIAQDALIEAFRGE